MVIPKPMKDPIHSVIYELRWRESSKPVYVNIWQHDQELDSEEEWVQKNWDNSITITNETNKKVPEHFLK